MIRMPVRLVPAGVLALALMVCAPIEAAPLETVADWVEEYRRFWDRSFTTLKEYVKTLQPQVAPSKRERAIRRKGRTSR